MYYPDWAFGVSDWRIGKNTASLVCLQESSNTQTEEVYHFCKIDQVVL